MSKQMILTDSAGSPLIDKLPKEPRPRKEFGDEWMKNFAAAFTEILPQLCTREGSSLESVCSKLNNRYTYNNAK